MRIRKRCPTVFRLPDLNLAPSTVGEDDEAPLLSSPSDLTSQRIHAQNGPSRAHVDVSRISSPKVAPFQLTTSTATRASETASVLQEASGKEEMGQKLISTQRALQENSFPKLIAWDRIVNVDYTHEPAAKIQELRLSTAVGQGHHRINSEIDYRCTSNLEEEEENSSADLHHSASAGKSVSQFDVDMGLLQATQPSAATETNISRRQISPKRCFSISDRHARVMQQSASHHGDGSGLRHAKEDSITPRWADVNVRINPEQQCGRTDGKDWQCKNMRAADARTIYCQYHRAKARENHAKNLHKHQMRKERKKTAALPSSILKSGCDGVISPEDTSQQQLRKTKKDKTKRKKSNKKRSLQEILTQQVEHVAVNEVVEAIHEDLGFHVQDNTTLGLGFLYLPTPHDFTRSKVVPECFLNTEWRSDV